MSNDIHMVDLLHMESRIEQLLPKKDLKKDGIHSGISLSLCVCVCVCVAFDHLPDFLLLYFNI
jgi:hypothetical protein